MVEVSHKQKPNQPKDIVGSCYAESTTICSSHCCFPAARYLQGVKKCTGLLCEYDQGASHQHGLIKS